MATTTARPPALPRPAHRGRAFSTAPRGSVADPAWARPALLGVLLLAAVLCF